MPGGKYSISENGEHSAGTTSSNDTHLLLLMLLRLQSGMSCVHKYFLMTMVDDHFDNLESQD
jgi:hypothetical protein